VNDHESELDTALRGAEGLRPEGLARRYAEVTLFVAVWMALGRALGWDDAVRYQLLGIPLTVGFQAWVRRAPIRALWVREAPGFPLDRYYSLFTLGLVAVPVWSLASAVSRGSGSQVAFASAASAGALAGGYALWYCDRASLRPFVLCLASQGTIAGALWAARATAGRAPALLAALEFLSFAFPLAFVVDEVSFRGVVDSHVYRPGERFAWGSALFVSSLWAVWHVPATIRESPGSSVLVVALFRILVQPVFSLPLSWAWRQTGNLAIPAFFHMVVDAVAEARP
jgi:hypothetical protein